MTRSFLCFYDCSGEVKAPWSNQMVKKPAVSVTDENGNKADVTLYNIWAGKVSTAAHFAGQLQDSLLQYSCQGGHTTADGRIFQITCIVCKPTQPAAALLPHLTPQCLVNPQRLHTECTVQLLLLLLSPAGCHSRYQQSPAAKNRCHQQRKGNSQHSITKDRQPPPVSAAAGDPFLCQS